MVVTGQSCAHMPSARTCSRGHARKGLAMQEAWHLEGSLPVSTRALCIGAWPDAKTVVTACTPWLLASPRVGGLRMEGASSAWGSRKQVFRAEKSPRTPRQPDLQHQLRLAYCRKPVSSSQAAGARRTTQPSAPHPCLHSPDGRAVAYLL